MTNSAAIGYMIIAAKQLKLDPVMIRNLDKTMYKAMDEISEEEAGEVYRNT